MLRRSLVPFVIAALGLALGTAPAAAGTPLTAKAVGWLATQQQSDGGFEVAGFAGFETLDAVLAIAYNAQADDTWSTAEARAAVVAVTEGGKSGLHYLDTYSSGALCPGQAAKLVVLSAVPLGFDPTAFDPLGNGGAVDLVTTMDGPGGGSCFAAFSDVLYRVIAHSLLGDSPDAGDVQTIRDGQQANGGWDFTGDSAGEDYDPDVTGLALRALVAADIDADDDAVAAGVDYLLGAELPGGGWASPFSGTDDDPNSTAMAMLGLVAAGVDPGQGPGCALERRQRTDGRVTSPSDQFGVNTFPTSQAVEGWLGSGFRRCRDLGHRVATADGGVFAMGNAPFLGSMGGHRLNQPVVGIASTPGEGYWLVASDGGVFSFGDATFHGSTGAIRLNQPMVGMATTPTGKGYWLVARDGGVFTFGDATFHGSTGAIRLNQPVVGMAATPSGKGYWLVAADGGIFAFGDAVFHGSTGGIRLNQPVVGMAATPTGGGYWLAASDGGVFSFGDAVFHGTLTNAAPVAGVVAATNGTGYRAVGVGGSLAGAGSQKGLGFTAGCLCGAVRAAVVGLAP